MKSVEREHQFAVMAMGKLEKALVENPGLLTAEGLSVSDLRNYRNNLDDTYFIRIFAEFETGLKDYWTNGLKKAPETRVMDVVNSVAAKHRILDDTTANVHKARKYRNHLVHHEDGSVQRVTVTEARRCFGRFFGRLPDDW